VEEEAPAERFSQQYPLPALLVRWYREGAPSSSTLDAHPESLVVVRLPRHAEVQSWGLSQADRGILNVLEQAAKREVTLDQVIRIAAQGDPTGRRKARLLLVLFRRLGYVDFRGLPWDEETTHQLDQLVHDLHKMQRQTLFQVLGLKEDVDKKAVKAAARDLVRKYHPDHHFEAHPRVRETASALFERVQEAYETLVHDGRREAYGQSLMEVVGVEAVGTPQAGIKDARMAKVCIKRGDLLLRNKRYANAAECFRDATLHDPASSRARVLFGWTTYLANPTNSATAIAEMDEAIRIEPECADAFFYKGRIANLQGEKEQARVHFMKAVKFDPRHIGASRELRLMERRGQAGAAAAPTKRRTGFRLFGRGGGDE
jgi:curved DNA-binding protein CbpA